MIGLGVIAHHDDGVASTPAMHPASLGPEPFTDAAIFTSSAAIEQWPSCPMLLAFHKGSAVVQVAVSIPRASCWYGQRALLHVLSPPMFDRLCVGSPAGVEVLM